ncbi:acetate--CoA ligase family protein [Bordetella muralis]|uniref:acetate--CoA ligase family protein n=1 Tax=Bordetella muralis TaxID=1649130 RepID=UPI0039EE480E
MNELHYLFNPRSIAVIGASDKPASIGARTLENLFDHSRYDGSIYLVSATRSELRGQRCYASIVDVPQTPDVAIVVIPAQSAVQVLQECAEKGVKFAVVLSSGFGEAGEQGQRLEAQIKQISAQSGMRIYGPNCPGACNINARLGMTFSPSFPHDLRPGPLGIATQGGGLGRNLMQAMERGIGVALWSSSGNEADLQVADFIDYMADAPDIKVILTLVEGIKDGAKFVAALQKAARNGKPVVALKVGRSEYGQRAAASHTASITGAAEVNSAALKQLGVIEVDDIDELIDVGWLLNRHMPDGRSDIAIYCSSGGAAALTADIVGQRGVRLTEFAPATVERLAALLPGYAAIGNPVDTTTAVLSNEQLMDSTLLAVCSDPGVALVLLPVTIDYGTTTEKMAQAVSRVQKESPVPILPIWMSDRNGKAFSMYAEDGIVPAKSIGKAVKAVRRWMDYGKWRTQTHPQHWKPWPTLGRAAPQGATPLSLSEGNAKSWLAENGLPVPRSALATSAQEAVREAAAIGFPVVAKVSSATLTHKSDIGGVFVNLRDAGAVHEAWNTIMENVHRHAPGAKVDGLLIEEMLPAGGVEVLIGVSRDPVFGHVITFGLGGIYVEVFKDVTRRLLPLQREEATAMLGEIRSSALLEGVRGGPSADVAALIDVLMKVSDFVGRHADAIDEIDLNPVWVGPKGEGAYVLDAVIVGRQSDDEAARR